MDLKILHKSPFDSLEDVADGYPPRSEADSGVSSRSQMSQKTLTDDTFFESSADVVNGTQEASISSLLSELNCHDSEIAVSSTEVGCSSLCSGSEQSLKLADLRSDSSSSHSASSINSNPLVKNRSRIPRPRSYPCRTQTASNGSDLSVGSDSASLSTGEDAASQSALQTPQASLRNSETSLDKRPVGRTSRVSPEPMETAITKSATSRRVKNESYVTPLQRKEETVKHLRSRLMEIYHVLEDREKLFHDKQKEKEEEIGGLLLAKDSEIASLEKEIAEEQDGLCALRMMNATAKVKTQGLERTVQQLKTEYDKREKVHLENYLLMYRKGQESLNSERSMELEILAREEPSKVTEAEMLKRLKDIQGQLNHWKTLRLDENYTQAPEAQIETDKAAKLRFMKDSMFHMLTSKKKEDHEQHLKALINMLNFSQIQKKNINKSLSQQQRECPLLQ